MESRVSVYSSLQRLRDFFCLVATHLIRWAITQLTNDNKFRIHSRSRHDNANEGKRKKKNVIFALFPSKMEVLSWPLLWCRLRKHINSHWNCFCSYCFRFKCNEHNKKELSVIFTNFNIWQPTGRLFFRRSVCEQCSFIVSLQRFYCSLDRCVF